MRVLGIDPGSITTGFGCVDYKNSRGVLVTSGIIRPKPKLIELRLKCIFEELRNVIEYTKPELIAIEKVFFAKNVLSAIVLGEARGVALCAAAMSDISIREISPNEVKSVVTGNGKAQKEQVQHMVSILIGKKDFLSSDESDAIAIAYSGAVLEVAQNRINA